jgi:hypothetical protein
MRFPVKLILIFLLITPVISLKAQTLIAHYPFDNTSASDISGNNNNGTLIGGVETTADRFGNPCGALLFNGVDGYIEVPNSFTLKSPAESFSATCWFKIKTSSGFNWLTLICKGAYSVETRDNPQYRIQVLQSSNQSTISINTEFTEYDNDYTSHLFQNEVWHFYALVYDGKFVRTYLDGNEIWKYPYENTLTPNDEPLCIAKDIPGATEYFNGSLDDLRIYSSGLTDKEVKGIYRDDTYAKFDYDFNLVCPDDIMVNAEPNKCLATVTYEQPVIDIVCGSTTLKQISGLPSGSQFPVGTHTIVFEGKSNYDVQKSCYSKIYVKDDEPPVIFPVNDTTVYMEDAKLKDKLFNYTMPLFTDNCGATIALKSGLPSGSKFPEGKTVLTFVATDKSGNKTELFYTVNVLKKEKSTTTKCPEDIVKENDFRKCGAIVTYGIPDSINQKALKLVEGKTSGSFFKVGETNNKFENGISNECLFKVTVLDKENPEIKCQTDTVIYSAKNHKGSRFYYSKPKALDNCKVDSVNQVKGLKSGDVFPVGATENSFVATDIYGNTAQCSFKVTVIDTFGVDEPIIVTKKTKTASTHLTDSIHYYKKGIDFKKCILTLSMYDDSKQDGDTVSLFFNGNEVVERQLITIKKNGTIDVSLELEPNVNNYFIFKAWNEGSISPNTLRIEFYEGYYIDKMQKLKRKKPTETIVMHAKVGVASAISLKCKE